MRLLREKDFCAMIDNGIAVCRQSLGGDGCVTLLHKTELSDPIVECDVSMSESVSR